jgi:hypothetical protein
VPLGREPAAGGAQLEGPQEVVRLLEVLAHCVDLVDQVLHRLDVRLPQALPHHCVVRQRDALPVQLREAALEHQFADGLARGVAEGDVGLDPPQQVGGGLVDAHEDAVVDLSEPQQAEDAQHLGVELVDAPDAHHEGQLGLGRNVDLAGELGLSAGGDLALVGCEVLGLVLLCSLEGLLAA